MQRVLLTGASKRAGVSHAPQARFFATAHAPLPGSPVSASEAVQLIKSHDRVYVHSFSGTPFNLLKALSEREDVRGVELIHYGLQGESPCATVDQDWLKAGRAPRFKINNLFVGPSLRKAVEEGRSTYTPVMVSEAPLAIRNGPLTPDVALLTVSPPDADGNCSVGLEATAGFAAAEMAKVILAEVNPHVPNIPGAVIPFARISRYIYNDKPLQELKAKPPSELEKQIGRHVAALVPDGATLQVGIGGVPDAVCQSLLENHKGLGLHTEMIGDGPVELIKAGVITNVNKKIHRGKSLFTFVYGSGKLYDFLRENTKDVLSMDAAFVNDPCVIRQNDKATAINAAIEIDLTGQVAADSVGTRQISGIGGQLDFIHGCAHSAGGVPIVCLPSTSAHGTSRIVPTLKPGTGVVTSRYHVRWVVTEHGAVNLFGLNYVQRAQALISIAAPEHRGQLELAAFERYRLKAW
ncbi:acetyl-CoA hydrolase/transferase [Hyaloraphidium curvatum]|nr:acetyl-CoA hydrolase/transferase [Hyaloraphidium curvatum]